MTRIAFSYCMKCGGTMDLGTPCPKCPSDNREYDLTTSLEMARKLIKTAKLQERDAIIAFLRSRSPTLTEHLCKEIEKGNHL